jgi:hypothetical protein
MAQELTAVTLHGLEAVLVAVELALKAGRVSGEHVLNLLSRLKQQRPATPSVRTALALKEPAQADVHRYDRLRTSTEAADVQ